MLLTGGTARITRELIPASVEIYAIPGYGAVEIGQWKVTRAISVGH